MLFILIVAETICIVHLVYFAFLYFFLSRNRVIWIFMPHTFVLKLEEHLKDVSSSAVTVLL